MQKWKKYIFLSDVVSLYLALVLAVIVRGIVHVHAQQTASVWIAAHTFIFLPSFLFSLLALYIAGLYDPKIIYDRAKTLALLLYTQFATAVFSIISFYAFHTNLTPKLTVFFYVIFSVTLLSLSRSYLFVSISKLPKVKALFWGYNKNLMEKLNAQYAPFTFDFFSERSVLEKEIENLGKNKLSYLVYDEKVLNSDNLIFIESLKQKGVSVFSYNQYFEFLFKKVDMENLYFEDLLREIAESKETVAHFLFRRFIDVFCALIIFPVYLLTLPFVWLGIRMEDGGGIFSKQSRVGFLGKNVLVYKIRTMKTTDSGGLISADAVKNKLNSQGNTYTKFGTFLRKSRIDELPQTINLLRGDISFIGPRANIIGVHNDMCKEIKDYGLRLLVPQGLTGWAQVHMNIQPKTKEEVMERTAFDLYYVKNRSILLDIAIILKTIKTIISREGA